MCSIGVESSFAVGTLGKRVDDKLLDAARVNLEVESTSDRVLPELRACVSTCNIRLDSGTYQGEVLDLGLLPSGEFLEGKFQSLTLNSESGGHGVSGGHPDIWVRSIASLGADSDALEFSREDFKHGHTGNECRGSQWYGEFISSSIVVTNGLRTAFRDGQGVEGGHLGRGEVV